MAAAQKHQLRSGESESAVALYLDLEPNELVDLEVAAAAAIEWSRAVKAAASAIEPDYEYRVTLIAADPGSSKWFARIERLLAHVEQSTANQAAERVKRGWQKLPLLLRVAIGLSVVIPTTGKPTYEYWFNAENFSDNQVQQIEQAVRRAQEAPSVQTHRRRIYQTVQRDRHIIAVGGGAAETRSWKPEKTIPVDQFAILGGLFDLQEVQPHERTIYPVLDVVLVTPRLENAPRAWVFRQEGLPGTISAAMKDKRFLAALERSEVRETLRANIPMRVRLEIKQKLIDGEWRVARRGRSVIEVIAPTID